MQEDVKCEVRRIFRLKTKEVVRDLSGNEIANIIITRGEDKNRIEIILLDRNVEVIVSD